MSLSGSVRTGAVSPTTDQSMAGMTKYWAPPLTQSASSPKSVGGSIAPMRVSSSTRAVQRAQGGAAWFLDATSQSSGADNTYGRAVCVPKKLFQDSASGNWLNEVNGDQFYNSNLDHELTNGYFDRAATLNGVSGDFDGGGEYAYITLDNRFNYLRWDLRGNSSSGALLRADYTIWGLASPGGNAIDLKSFPGGVDNVSSWDSTGNGEKALRLDDSDASICYLRKFQGRFDGRGEWIRIDQGQSSADWYLTVRGACKNSPSLVAGACDGDDWKRVESEASCYKYDQSN